MFYASQAKALELLHARHMKARKEVMAFNGMQQAQQVPPEDAPQGVPVGPQGHVGLAAPWGSGPAQVGGQGAPRGAILVGQLEKGQQVGAGPTC